MILLINNFLDNRWDTYHFHFSKFLYLRSFTLNLHFGVLNFQFRKSSIVIVQFNFIQLNYQLFRGFNHIYFAHYSGKNPGEKRQMIFEDLQNIFEDEDLSRIHKGSLKDLWRISFSKSRCKDPQGHRKDLVRILQ